MLMIDKVRTGRLQGKFQLCYDNGRLQSEENYHKGRLHGMQRAWYPSGQPKKEVPFINGAMEGQRREWYADGKLKMECQYRRNKLDGLMAEWYATGQVRERGNYWQGKRHGIWKEFDPQGRIEVYQLYVLGARLAGRTERSLRRGRLNARSIARIQSSNVRRICLTELGYARLLNDCPYEIIDHDEANTLIRLRWHPQEEMVYLVKVRCPSTGVFYTLRVPPDVKTVKAAVAWTFEVAEADYQPEEET